MKILVVTDAIDQAIYSSAIKQRFSDVELVLSCGDLPSYYLEFIVTMLDVPLFYVRGNHDHELVDSSGDGRPGPPGGCTLIDGHIAQHNGLVVAGLGGSRRYNGKPDQYSDGEMRWRMLLLEPALLRHRRKTGRGCDILVTHAPPRGINDQEDVCHQGFPTFLKFLDRYRPHTMVHGHIHLYNRNAPYRATYAETEIVNAFPFRVLDVPVSGARTGAALAAGGR